MVEKKAGPQKFRGKKNWKMADFSRSAGMWVQYLGTHSWVLGGGSVSILHDLSFKCVLCVSKVPFHYFENARYMVNESINIILEGSSLKHIHIKLSTYLKFPISWGFFQSGLENYLDWSLPFTTNLKTAITGHKWSWSFSSFV